MDFSGHFTDLIEDKLLALHTAYIGKVLSYSNGKADIQPLNMTKQYGKAAQKPSVVKNVPVIHSARYKMQTTTIEGTTVITPTELSTGDLVFCVCAERNITEALKGNMATPPIGHHSKSDSVVVGIL